MPFSPCVLLGGLDWSCWVDERPETGRRLVTWDNLLTAPCLSLFMMCGCNWLCSGGASVSTLVPFPSVSIKRQTSLHRRGQHSAISLCVSWSCRDCFQHDPKNMGENINIFCKKGNITSLSNSSQKFFSAFSVVQKKKKTKRTA